MSKKNHRRKNPNYAAMFKSWMEWLNKKEWQNYWRPSKWEKAIKQQAKKKDRLESKEELREQVEDRDIE
jgi:hypothetical protein